QRSSRWSSWSAPADRLGSRSRANPSRPLPMDDKLRVQLQLLGPFDVRLEGAPSQIIDLPAGRMRALLAYLAMQPGCRDTRERLAALLWGDGPDKLARQS